jgi:thiamine biosynthesis protein ThiS
MITVNGTPHSWREGMTVRDALVEKKYGFPLVIVKIDGKLIPRGAYDETGLPDGCVLEVIHLMSGG